MSFLLTECNSFIAYKLFYVSFIVNELFTYKIFKTYDLPVFKIKFTKADM